MLRLADALSQACSLLSDLLLVAIGVIVTMDVVLRYVFNAPTIWAQDVAIACQVWLTYLGMAYALRRRQMIRITALLSNAGRGVRRAAEGFSLIVIIAFSAMAVIYGTGFVSESIRLGRREPTMLEMPKWVSELPIVVGFLLLGVQALADLLRLPARAAPGFSAQGEHQVTAE